MVLLVPAVVFYALGAAVALGVLVEILVSVVQSAVNEAANTARGLRLLRQYLRHKEEFEEWLAESRRTRDKPHGKAQEDI